MPKHIPEEIKLKAMRMYLKGDKSAKQIADELSINGVVVSPPTIYAWAKKDSWGAQKAVASADQQQQIAEYIKYGLITIIVIAFIGVALGIMIKFVWAHQIEGDETSCKLYEPKYFLICMSEGRGYADTQLYLDYQKEKENWIIEKD